MKRIVLESPRQLAVREAVTPKPGVGEALVKVHKVGLCGSDLHMYRDGRIGEIRMDGPQVLGHECMGVVAEVGHGVSSELVGRRVAVEPAIGCGRCKWCDRGTPNVCPEVRFLGLPANEGALQECLLHPARLLEPLPDGIGDEAAVVLEPMAIALHALNLAKVRAGQTVVILGTGVLGTCVLSLLRLQQSVRVVCVDLLADRLERARQMGAAITVQAGAASRAEIAEQICQAVGGEGAEVVFECAGDHETMWNMCEVAAPAGHVVVVGITDDDRICFSSGTSRRKGLTLRLVRRSLQTLRDCIRLAEQGLIRPEELVTHRFTAAEITKAFETVDTHADGVLKAIVDMQKWC